jgi:hypothetical protein
MLAVIQDDAEALALFREAMVEGPGKRSKDRDYITDNISNIPVDHGTSKSYTVSRLKRDRPDLFERVVAGELSANRQPKPIAGTASYRRYRAISNAWRILRN